MCRATDTAIVSRTRAPRHDVRIAMSSEPVANVVPRLTVAQLASFKTDGYLVLPDVLERELIQQLREEAWREIESFVRLRQDDPSSWGALEEEDVRHLSKRRPDKNNSHEGGDPRFEGSGHRFYLKNGADELHLNAFPRALWSVVEQLLGEGTVVWPRGVVNGMISGPCFMDASTESGLSTHWATTPRWPPPMKTETLSTTPTAAGHLNGQATRGLYCTLPNSSDPRLPAGEAAGAKQRTPTSGDKFWPSMHSDGGGESRVRLRATAFIDACPQEVEVSRCGKAATPRCGMTSGKVCRKPTAGMPLRLRDNFETSGTQLHGRE